MIEIYIDLFECYVRIYGVSTKEEYERLVSKASGDPYYTINHNSDGCACPKGIYDNNKLCYIMYVENGNKIDLFMHELFHIVSAIDREFDLCEETCAYLIQFIVRKFNESFTD